MIRQVEHNIHAIAHRGIGGEFRLRKRHDVERHGLFIRCTLFDLAVDEERFGHHELTTSPQDTLSMSGAAVEAPCPSVALPEMDQA